jgi:hypothetical protein
LISNRVASHLMDSGQHENRAGRIDAHRSVKRVAARQDLAAANRFKWRMDAQTIHDQTQDGGNDNTPSKAPEARDEGPEGCNDQGAELSQRLNDPPLHELEEGIQATGHFCHTPVAEPNWPDRDSLAALCGVAVRQLWRSVAARTAKA